MNKSERVTPAASYIDHRRTMRYRISKCGQPRKVRVRNVCIACLRYRVLLQNQHSIPTVNLLLHSRPALVQGLQYKSKSNVHKQRPTIVPRTIKYDFIAWSIVSTHCSFEMYDFFDIDEIGFLKENWRCYHKKSTGLFMVQI